MKNKFLILISIIFTILVSSCKNENSLALNVKEPDNLLTKDSLINILVDIHLADAIISQATYVNEEKKAFTYSAYGTIFKKHNINKTRFETSLGYYSASPEELHKIYEQILAKLSELEGNSMAKEAKSEKKK